MFLEIDEDRAANCEWLGQETGHCSRPDTASSLAADRSASMAATTDGSIGKPDLSKCSGSGSPGCQLSSTSKSPIDGDGRAVKVVNSASGIPRSMICRVPLGSVHSSHKSQGGTTRDTNHTKESQVWCVGNIVQFWRINARRESDWFSVRTAGQFWTRSESSVRTNCAVSRLESGPTTKDTNYTRKSQIGQRRSDGPFSYLLCLSWLQNALA